MCMFGVMLTRPALHCSGVELTGQSCAPSVGRGANRDSISTWGHTETKIKAVLFPQGPRDTT